MAEPRTLEEGSLWWVQQSGSGTAWATASAPNSGLFGYVQSMSYTSARQIATLMDRGIPLVHKEQSRNPIQLNVQFLWTGFQPTAVSGASASMPMMLLEYKAVQPESANAGRYLQFYGAATQQDQFNEQAQGDTIQKQFVCLGMNGPTGSGYLS